MQVFRQIEGYHFRSQSWGRRPRKKIRPGVRPVSGFLFQFTPGGLQRAFLPFIPGNARRQPYGPGMQGNAVFFHQKQFAFSGRARRSEFWGFVLAQLAVLALVTNLATVASGRASAAFAADVERRLRACTADDPTRDALRALASKVRQQSGAE